MNLLLKLSRFFDDLQINVLLTKTFLVSESLVNYKSPLIGTSIVTIKVFLIGTYSRVCI